jgi:tetratricopeptide (TPR) repeat protein
MKSKSIAMAIPITFATIGVLSIALAWFEWKKAFEFESDLEVWKHVQTMIKIVGALLVFVGAIIIWKVQDKVSYYEKMKSAKREQEQQQKDDADKQELLRAGEKNTEIILDAINKQKVQDRINSEPDKTKDLEQKIPEIKSSSIRSAFKTALDLQNAGNAKEAIQNYNQVIKAADALKDTQEALITKGSAYINLGLIKATLELDVNSALREFSKAETIYRELNDKNGLASVYLNQARIYDLVGKSNEAILLNKDAIALYKETENHREHSRTLNNIGIVFRAQGNIKKSIEIFNEALEIADGVQPLTEEIQLNLGISLLNSGQLNKAEIYFSGITISKKFKGYALGNLGLIAAKRDHVEVALNYHKEALKLFEEINDRLGIANETANVGNMLGRLGSFDQAVKALTNAINLHQDIPFQYGLATDYMLLGGLYLKESWFRGKGVASEGKKQLLRAQAIFKDIRATAKVKEIDDILGHLDNDI